MNVVATLRDAGPEDAAEVADVHVRAWQAAYRGLIPDVYLDGLRSEDRAASYTFGVVGPEHPLTTVAVDDGQVCGFVTTGPARADRQSEPVGGRLEDDPPVGGELYALYVDPTAWGRGVGRQLIAHGRSRLAELGFTAAILWVLEGNERGERFYRADGWVADGARREDEVWGVMVGEVRFARRLR